MHSIIHLYLIGYPVEHSRSPEIHNLALQKAGLHHWRYSLLPTPPEALPRAVARFRQADCAGGNVTIPHKQAIIPFLDALTPDAQAIGAVNTIFKRGGKLWGDNTDAEGFWLDLQRLFGDMPAGEALILGAGGAARAVCYALARRNWRVQVAARRPEQAEALCRALSPLVSGQLSPLRLDVNLPVGKTTRLLINATPVGMSPRTEASPWPENTPLPPAARLYDLIYNPAETLLMRQARAAGLQAVNGMGMLRSQAALAFTRWVAEPH